MRAVLVALLLALAATAASAQQTLTPNTPLFYEILTLSEVNGSLEFRLRHFHPDLKGWEEKDLTVAMPFVAKRDGVLHFDGMAFKQTGPDAITVYLAIEDHDGGGKPPREATFTYTRAT